MAQAAPAPPKGLHAVDVTSRSVSLTWRAGADAASYTVLRGDRAVAVRIPRKSLRVAGLAPATAYTFRVQANDRRGRVGRPASLRLRTRAVRPAHAAATSPARGAFVVRQAAAAPKPATAAGAPAPTVGLTGTYFSKPDLTGASVRRVDPQVNFSWWLASPSYGIGADQFSVRWTGQFQPKTSETYTFYLNSDDGARLWLDGQLLLDRWTGWPTETTSRTISLVAGQRYDIRIEYVEGTGVARSILSYSTATIAKQVVPSDTLSTTFIPAPAAGSQPCDCAITSARKLGDGGDGDWSSARNTIAYDAWDANHVYQLHTVNPDGSNDVCLTCTPAPGGPSAARHKLAPTWSPDGSFIVAAVEMENHPLAGWNVFNNPLLSELSMNGTWTDLYALSPDGQRWYRLTDSSTVTADGVMGPHFSRDGRKLFWSRLVGSASATAPYGTFRLMVADFQVRNGVPSLANTQDITPPGAGFVEAQGFSPDGTKVLFNSNMNVSGSSAMDTYSMDLATRAVSRLTPGDGWTEHAYYTPSGAHIMYMSWQSGVFFGTELSLMNPDGSGKTQLTHVNSAGYPESIPGISYVMRPSFSPDARQMIVTVQSVDHYPARQQWLLTFSGSCG